MCRFTLLRLVRKCGKPARLSVLEAVYSLFSVAAKAAASSAVQHTGQVLVKCGLDLRLGGFQAFGLSRWGTAAGCAGRWGHLCGSDSPFASRFLVRRAMAALSACSSSASCRLRAAGVVAQLHGSGRSPPCRRPSSRIVSSTSFSASRAIFGNFAFGNIHSRLRIRANWLHLHRCTYNHCSLLSAFVNKSRKFIPAAQYKKQNRHTQPAHFVLYLFYIMV